MNAALTGAGCLAAVGIALVLSAVSASIFGWWLMLLLGALWHEFEWLRPIAYWPCVGIAFLMSMIFNALRPSSGNSR
jgi:hypothetical protein